MATSKVVPTGVKVISVLHYIGAVFGLIFGILLLAGASFIGASVTEFPLFNALGSALFIVGGIILIAMGVLAFFIGRGLWNAKPWARIITIIFSVIGLISAIFSMASGEVAENIFNLILNGVIGGYLIFSTKVKNAFS